MQERWYSGNTGKILNSQGLRETSHGANYGCSEIRCMRIWGKAMQVYPPPGLSINFWPGIDSTNCSGPGAVEEMGEEKQVEGIC